MSVLAALIPGRRPIARWCVCQRIPVQARVRTMLGAR
jgi:hypothetical protein